MGSTLCTFLMTMVVLFLWVQHSSSEPDAATKALINQVCRQTDDFNDCEKSFYEDLYNDAMDAAGLTEIALAQASEHATGTNVFLQNALSNERTGTNKVLYQICISDYGLLITDVDNANTAFAQQDYNTMILNVEKCQKLVDNCQSVLVNKLAGLSAKNSHAKVLIQMALVSGKLIG